MSNHSYYNLILSDTPTLKNLKQIFDILTSNALKDQISEVRRSQDSDEKGLLKRNLPAFTISATFNGSRKATNIIVRICHF